MFKNKLKCHLINTLSVSGKLLLVNEQKSCYSCPFPIDLEPNWLSFDSKSTDFQENELK